MNETPKSINAWANSVFGEIPEGEEKAALRRLQQELDEAKEAETTEKLIEELADIEIVLWRLVGHLRVNLQKHVNIKMKKNRKRKWTPDGTGHGQHIKEEEKEQNA